MDPSTHWALDCEVEKKCANPEMSFKSRGREHKKVEQRDSGFGSDRSVSPPSRIPSSEKRMSNQVCDTEDDRSGEINTHRKLERTASVQWPLDSSQHSRTRSAKGGSCVFSCVSMRSNISKHHPPGFKATPSGDEHNGAPEPSALSVKSEMSTELVGNLSVKTPNTGAHGLDEEKSDSEHDSFDSMETAPGLQEDDTSCDSLSSNHSDEGQPTDGLLLEPSDESSLHEVKEKLKEEYKNKLKFVYVETEKRTVLLNDIYIEPYFTQDDEEEAEEEESPVHKLSKLRSASRQARLRVFPVKWNIFDEPPDQPPEEQREIKTVLTKGIPGIGKTVCLQKFILDWAEGKSHQEIDVILAFSVQDLNLRKEEDLSLTELLQHFFPQIKQIHLNAVRVMLIFDGLDEYHLPLDFQHNPNCSDPSQPTTVDVLLTNLIKGNLLPSALLWITSRPRAVNAIPSEYLQRVTEIQGFKDAQKEDYFYKRISDETKASNIISHIKTSESLRRLCHIPAYCSLLVAVLQDTLDNTNAPQTLVQILTCSLLAALQSKDHTE